MLDRIQTSEHTQALESLRLDRGGRRREVGGRPKISGLADPGTFQDTFPPPWLIEACGASFRCDLATIRPEQRLSCSPSTFTNLIPYAVNIGDARPRVT